MASLFNPNVRTLTSQSRQKVQNADQVILRKFLCIADVVAGSSEVLDVDKTISGLLKSTPFARGAMKLAFDVSLLFCPDELFLNVNLLFISFMLTMGHSWWPSTSSVSRIHRIWKTTQMANWE